MTEQAAVAPSGPGPVVVHNHLLPAWRRPTQGEARWPVALTVLVAVALQVLLPSRLGLHPKYLIPGLEAALLIALTVANPGRFTERSSAPTISRSC